jgi:hypothetical protein
VHPGLGSLSILYWSRIGKIATFMGETAAILDLIGPHRLRKLGQDPDIHQKIDGTGQKLVAVAQAAPRIVAVAILLLSWPA